MEKKTFRIIIHCSATDWTKDYTEQDLERDHNARDINSPMGYHRYIRKNGATILGRKFGVKGAHAYGYNDDSIGICYEGGLKRGGKDWRDAEDTRTEQQKASLLENILCAVNWVLANKTGYEVEIIGHGGLPGVNKECPSFKCFDEYSWITA